VLNQGKNVVVPAREIIHDVMCPLFHPLIGVSPIYAAGYPAMQLFAQSARRIKPDFELASEAGVVSRICWFV